MKCNIDCPYSKYNGKNRDGTQNIICHSRNWFMDSSKECIEGYTEEHMEQLKKVCSPPPKERFRVFTDIENREEVIVDLDEIPTDDYNVVKLSLQEACDVLNNFEIENEQLKKENIELKLDIEELLPFKEKPSTVDPVIPLLHKEIDRLTTENEQLKKRIKKSVT